MNPDLMTLETSINTLKKELELAYFKANIKLMFVALAYHVLVLLHALIVIFSTLSVGVLLYQYINSAGAVAFGYQTLAAAAAFVVFGMFSLSAYGTIWSISLTAYTSVKQRYAEWSVPKQEELSRMIREYLHQKETDVGFFKFLESLETTFKKENSIQ